LAPPGIGRGRGEEYYSGIVPLFVDDLFTSHTYLATMVR
jgi:hypothetical protein